MHFFSPRLWLLCILIFSWSLAVQSDELRQQARLGDPQAQFELAIHYQQAQQSDQAYFWLLQSSERGYKPAMMPLADTYLHGLGTAVDVTQALVWYTKAATLGDTDAALTIARLYSQGEHLPQSLTMAEIWYHAIADRQPLAAQRYSELLQQRFDQRRMNQLSALDTHERQTTQSSSVNTESLSPHSSLQPPDLMRDFLYILVGLLLIMGILTLFRSLKVKRHLETEQQITNQQQQLHQQAILLKKQKRQLEHLANQLEQTKQQQQSLQQDKTFALACAVLGFHPNRLPDEQTIRHRYKQLSKIYHPDLKGSEEAMKRLNGAMKIVTKKRTN